MTRSGPGWVEVCRRCGRIRPLGTGGWYCPCGGLLDLQGPAADPFGDRDAPAGSIWRYRPALPTVGAGAAWTRVTLGEGQTPLLSAGPGWWVKCEFVNPTRSFKDRGAAVMISVAADLGVDRVVADSSGNAGTAVAAYAGRAGMSARVFVPEGTPAAKVAAIEAFGAEVVTGGDRAGAATAARQAAAGPGRDRAWYASHVHRPAFVHGVKTLAFELWEQLGGRAPGSVVVPAGNGTLVMGVWLGFRQLGVEPPPIVAVQAERCAPLVDTAPPVGAAGPTAATGIAIAHPPRAGDIRAVIRISGGRIVAVSEDAIAAAVGQLGRQGLRVEPTGAVAWAGRQAARQLAGDGPIVVVLSGGAV